MRKHLYLAVAAASALLVAAPTTSANAATSHVLTIGKAGGTAVKPGAVLKVGLAKGAKAIFTTKLGTKTVTLTCTSAGSTAKVGTNPIAKGTATESVTAQTFAKCTVSLAGVKLKSIVTQNLPYKATVSDSTGFPVTITGQSTTKPLQFTATASFGTITATCTYTAAKVKGNASNRGNTITFKAQVFTLKKGPCGKTAAFSATFGPVRDTSVTGNPAVFVN